MDIIATAEKHIRDNADLLTLGANLASYIAYGCEPLTIR